MAGVGSDGAMALEHKAEGVGSCGDRHGLESRGWEEYGRCVGNHPWWCVIVVVVVLFDLERRENW